MHETMKRNACCSGGVMIYKYGESAFKGNGKKGFEIDLF